ncbi:MAG: peptide/nickel transport system substrate-binding protein [Rhodospirillaceae bacterium]|nr:peptide/nickel transport system substrate-binding protein [Rhodospirillaceae bacterium]
MRDLTELLASLTSGSIDRREFMRGATAIGVSGVMATAMVSETALAQTPKRGGNLILGLNGASAGDSLDPGSWASTQIQVFGHQLYNLLIETDDKVRLVPSLAESWEARAGAAEWVIRIRKGVTFHNGKELTAADVVHSLNHHRKKDSKSGAKALVSGMTDIKTSDKHEVTITLDGANADLPYLLSVYQLCIGPEGSAFNDGMGTGPFILETFQPGVRGITKRNPNYWRSDRAFVDSVETIAINDANARLNALVSGSVHLINRLDPKVVSMLQANKSVQIFEISGASHYCFAMRCDAPPFDNKDLRLALKHAVDREAIVKTVLAGHGKVANDHPIASFSPFYAADIPQTHYDPDKAKYYFKKANSGPIALVVSDAAFLGAVDAAQIFQSSAAKAGIDIEVQRAPADGYWDNVWRKKPFCATYWSGRPTADLMLSIAYKSTAPWNESAWKRPAFDKLLAAARAELDEAKRKSMYRELQMMVHEDGGTIIPMFNNTLDAGSTKVKGYVSDPMLQISGYRAPEKVWLDL